MLRPAWLPSRGALFASLALLAAASSGCGGEADDSLRLPADTPVVLIVIDTLRADRLGCYGYPLATSPVIDALAERSYLFTANSTQCNSTFPSLSSILTGLYPKTHRNYLAVPIAGTADRSEGAACLAERLRARGHHTIAIVSHPSWENADPDAVIMRGWDRMSIIGEPIPILERSLWAHAEYTNERLFPLLDEWERDAGGAPLFLWAHYFDPHTDLPPNVYNAPPSTRNLFLRQHLAELGVEAYHDGLAALEPKERTEWIRAHAKGPDHWSVVLANGRACYDAEIRSCDAGIGALIERLEEAGVWERALVILMADHGENMEPADSGHGAIAFTHKRLYEGVSHTPLLIRLPGQEQGVVVDALTQNIDVLPTILQLLDLPPGPPVEGKSLVPLMRDPTARLHEHVFIESSDYVEKAVKSDELKYIDRGEDEAAELYAWRKDAAERRDLLEALDEERWAPLVGAMEAFRPIDSVRLRMEPMDEPYELRLDVVMPGSTIDRVVGAPEECLSQERKRFTWSGTVGAGGTDILLFPRRRNTEMRWKIEHGGTDRPWELVHIGKTPVTRTTAIPVWSAGEGEPPAQPQLVLAEEAGRSEFTVEVHAAAEARVELELRHPVPSYEKGFELLEAEGFGPLEELRGRVFRGAAPGGRAFVRIARSKKDPLVYRLVRLDGSWPDPERVVVGGRAARTDSLEFVFPHPLDGRLTAVLMAGREPERVPPGALTIWLETGGGGGEIDAALLSPELAEQLRAIGYLGDEGGGGEQERDDQGGQR